MKRPLPFHPPLFAIYPALSLYAANVALISWRSVIVPVLITIAGGVTLWGLSWLVMRDLQRAAAVASAMLLGFFSFDLLSWAWATMIYGEVLGQNKRAPIWLWAVLILAISVLFGWK